VTEPIQKCCAQVRKKGLRWPTFSPCRHNATVTHDGKPYCTQHDPEHVKAREKARSQRWFAEAEQRLQGVARLDALRRIADAAIAWRNGGPLEAVRDAVDAWEKLK